MKRPAKGGKERPAKKPRTLPPIGQVAEDNYHVFISLQESSERVGKLFEDRHSVVFIRGGVATGKTTFAEHLAGQFPDKYVMVPFTNAGEESAWQLGTVEAIEKATSQTINKDDLAFRNALKLAANKNLTLVYDEAHTLQAALDVTARCDQALGLVENLRKRQLWQAAESVEHLGLRLSPATLEPPHLRAGWGPVLDLIALLPRLPGGFAIRANAARVFIKPMWEWPLPLLQSPPWDVTLRIQRALLCSCSTWWCRARVFADHVDLQPQYGSAVAALTRAAALPCTPQLLACVEVHAAQLGLEVQEPVRGSYTLRIPHGDRRVRQLLSSGFPPRWGGVVDGGTPAGQHALRLLARNKCLSHVNLSRQDAEGLLDADLTLPSERVWRDWVASLSRDHCLFLRIFRGGAVSSPARRQSIPGADTSCPFCGGGSRDNRAALLNPGGSSSELAPIGGNPQLGLSDREALLWCRRGAYLGLFPLAFLVRAADHPRDRGDASTASKQNVATPVEINQKFIWTPPLSCTIDLKEQLEAADVRLDQQSIEFFMQFCGGHRGIFMAAMHWVSLQQKEKKKKEIWGFTETVKLVRESYAHGDWNKADGILSHAKKSRAIHVNGRYQSLDAIPEEFIRLLCSGSCMIKDATTRRDLSIHGFILPKHEEDHELLE
ncbi:unnamed protein product, partial [Symbiodinium necroappetens]